MTEKEFIQQAEDALKRLTEMDATMDIIRARLAQPKREWIDLTPTEIKLLRRAANNDREFAALLIARFKEKNNG